MIKPLPLKNKDYGFYGTMKTYGYSDKDINEVYIDLFNAVLFTVKKADPLDLRNFFDSINGRKIADALHGLSRYEKDISEVDPDSVLTKIFDKSGKNSLKYKFMKIVGDREMFDSNTKNAGLVTELYQTYIQKSLYDEGTTETGGFKSFNVKAMCMMSGSEQAKQEEFAVRCNTPEEAKDMAMAMAKEMNYSTCKIVSVEMVPNSDNEMNNYGSGEDMHGNMNPDHDEVFTGSDVSDLL